jgi:type VI secretion system protein ImpF
MEGPDLQDRVQPSLLDRLTDDDPSNRREDRSMRHFSLARLREAVLRDLSWLFNTAQLAATTDLEPYPYVADSVLNFGVPPTTGRIKAGVEPQLLTRQLRQALLRFEPRLLPGSIRVSVRPGQGGEIAFQFLIEADLWAHPLPLRLALRTEAETGLDIVRVVAQQPGGQA